MKAIQKALRILISPFIFLLGLGAMIIFPGPICFMMGIIQIFGKLLGVNIDETWGELLLITFTILLYPCGLTYYWIKYATLSEEEVAYRERLEERDKEIIKVKYPFS